MRIDIHRLGSEVNPQHLDGLVGLLRDDTPDKNYFTIPRLKEYFAEYREAARRNKASLYIALIAPDMMADSDLGGFSHTVAREAGGVGIKNLYVKPGYARRANVGSLLLEKVVEDAKNIGAEYVQYDGFMLDPAGEEFLKAHNFDNNSTDGRLRLELQSAGALT